MPRVQVPVTQASRDGVTLPAATVGDAVEGHYLANDGDVIILAENTGVTPRTITFYTVKSVDGLAAPTRVETVAAGETQVFGPFDPTQYGSTLDIDVAHAELTMLAIGI